MTWKQNVTLRNPKMYPHTKFGIHTSDNIGDNYAPDKIFLELRPEVKGKVTVTCRQYAILRNIKMYQHTKFGIPKSNNIEDMLWTPLF